MVDKIVIVTAPSGSGKTTIVRHLLKTFPRHLGFSISATTRAKRSYEEEGEHYYFMDEVRFRKGIADGEFIEWEEVYEGQLYGTLRSELKRIQDQNKVVIFDVDVIGALDLKAEFENSMAVFIQPPSLSILRQRLENRKSETPNSLAKRIRKATYELQFSSKFDYILVNDQLDVALKEAELLIESYAGLYEEE